MSETILRAPGAAAPFPLADPAFAEEYCRALSRQDPIAAQKGLCDALANAVGARHREFAGLHGLRVLERHARLTGERLLSRYVEGDAQLRSLERKVWVSALRLSQTFSSAYEQWLGSVERTAGDVPADMPRLLVGILRHRQVEFLLRMFRFKKRNGSQWSALHRVYRFARARSLEGSAVTESQADGAAATAMTPEQQYVRSLLLEIMNTGQFPPRETLWAHGWFASWCRALRLRSTSDPPSQGFVVDPAGADGPKRASVASGEPVLHLDPAPLLTAIDDQAAALRDPIELAEGFTSAVRDRQLALLAKLRIVFSPEPVRIARRGERIPVDLTVQAVSGFLTIVYMLRDEARAQAAKPAVEPDESTISPFGGPTWASAWAANEWERPTPETWQVKDRSDSGCRMRMRADDLTTLIPGSLLALRGDEREPWTLVVVRRLRRLMVDYVELGAEYIGSRPRFVKLVPDYRYDPAEVEVPDPALRCFAALYLPPSTRYPTLPIKTLLIPSREFRPGRSMTLLSSNAIYTLCLNESIQHHAEFAWTSFTVVERIGGSELPARLAAS